MKQSISTRPTISICFFFFSSRRRHTRLQGDWSSDVCSSDLLQCAEASAFQSARKKSHASVSRAIMQKIKRDHYEDRGFAKSGQQGNLSQRLQFCRFLPQSSFQEVKFLR